MKNKIIVLLMMTMIAGSMLVGCDGNTDNADTNNAGGTEVSVNVDTNDNTANIEYGVSNPDATYNETEYSYVVSDAKFVEEKYNDGTEFDPTNWTPVNKTIQLKESINIYNPFKDIMGYMKTDVTVIYVSVDGEWSYLGFAQKVAENGLYPAGGTYVRTDELQAVMEEVEVVEEAKEETEMSAEAKEIFAMFRDKVAENNETREEAQKQYPNMTIPPLVEADSAEGLESFGTFYCSLEDKDGLEGLLIAFITQDYNTYYIEYVGEANLGVEINIYGGK